MEEKKIKIVFNLKAIKHNISNYIVGETYQERNDVLKEPFKHIEQQLQLKDKMIELMAKELSEVTGTKLEYVKAHFDFATQQALAELEGK